jgi:hypothetical protein
MRAAFRSLRWCALAGAHALYARRPPPSLDALYLAAALLLPGDKLTVASWGRRLYAAASAERLTFFPEAFEGKAGPRASFG